MIIMRFFLVRTAFFTILFTILFFLLSWIFPNWTGKTVASLTTWWPVGVSREVPQKPDTTTQKPSTPDTTTVAITEETKKKIQEKQPTPTTHTVTKTKETDNKKPTEEVVIITKDKPSKSIWQTVKGWFGSDDDKNEKGTKQPREEQKNTKSKNDLDKKQKDEQALKELNALLEKEEKKTQKKHTKKQQTETKDIPTLDTMQPERVTELTPEELEMLKMFEKNTH